MTSTLTAIPVAPPCPAWCESDHSTEPDWAYGGRLCIRRTMRTDRMQVEAVRWSDPDEVRAPGVYVDVPQQDMTVEQAQRLAVAIRLAAAIVSGVAG